MHQFAAWTEAGRGVSCHLHFNCIKAGCGQAAAIEKVPRFPPFFLECVDSSLADAFAEVEAR
jgi:hypothetical protein